MKNLRKVLSMMVAVCLVLTGMLTHIQPVFATSEQVTVLETGFDNFPEEKPEGWTFDTTAVYTSDGNFGEAKPSLKFDKNGQVVETKEFSLLTDGVLSFWVKGQGGSNPVTSILHIDAWVNDEWVNIEPLNLGDKNGEVIEFPIEKAATKIRFVFNKDKGNVSIDDIKLVAGSSEIIPVPLEGLTVADKISLETGEEATISVDYVPVNTTEKGVSFTSENEEIATVSKEGVLSAVAVGTTNVIVTSKKNPTITATVEVEVKKTTDKQGPEFKDLTPKPGSTIKEGNKVVISMTIADETAVDFNSLEVLFNGNDISKAVTVEGNKVSYTVPTTLTPDVYTIMAKVNDTLGNETLKEWSFSIGSAIKNLYYGQIHSHTNLSDGIGTPDEAYKYARDNAGLDFFAITDHSNSFDNADQASMGDGSMSSKWKQGRSSAEKYNKDGEYAAFYAYEMSWSGSTGGYGHMNTFNTPGFETRTNPKMDLKTYYETLKKYPESISMFNHPGPQFGDFRDFAHYDEEIDNVVTLIEVGNGEGQVGGSGYFPSYEFYNRALDKGWHIAPTNGQDNHKGKWGNSNSTRTVVEAPYLSRESVYQAFRDRRVYSTEDENLRISYELNGSTMGSILEDTDTLNFNVKVEDPDANDKISKIQIIGNGGVVVKEITNVNANVKEWKFEMPSNYSYYYVKVVQEDKQIAVTAPVWVGENFNAGIGAVNTDKELVFPGEEVKVETKIYNNDANALTDVKVEYFLNNETKKLVENTIAEIPANGEVVDVYNYVPERAGKHDILVKATVNVDGVEHIFTNKTQIIVKNDYEVSKIVIDASHQNYYVSGDYAGKMTALTKLAEQYGSRLVMETEKITTESLEGASLLILTDPQSYEKADYGLSPQKYEADEIEAIKAFVEKGGNIVITSRADYGDVAGEYGNAYQSNSVLEAIGSTLRFNDDQVIDPTNNGGQPYRLYFDKYNTDSKFLKGVDTSLQYSFYSGNSVLLTDKNANAEVLVYSHETTTNSDADNQGDYTSVAPGEIVPIASETLANGSTIIAAGTTFFSDFETLDANASKYTNAGIMTNIIKNLAPEPVLPVTSIKDVRVDADNDNMPDNIGETFVIEGTVTAGSKTGMPNNSFFDVVYVQDETAGITVFGVSETSLKPGQKVRIKGAVDEYLGDTELTVSNEDTDITILDESINELDPTVLATKDSMLEKNEGLLVKVEGKVEKMDEQNVYVNDGSGISRSYVEGYIGSKSGKEGHWSDGIKVGDTISVIGLASEDPEGKRLRVRDTDEIVKVKAGEELPPTENPDGDESKPGEDGSNPDGNGSNSDEGDSNPGEGESSLDTDNSKPSQDKNPPTGDDTNLPLYGAVLLLAVGGLYGLRKFKKVG